jgi:dephospho-CoA kinase
MSERKIRIGLTGGFGTGKSTVAGIFKELGAGIIDADELARECLRPGREEYGEAIEQFGDKILTPDGGIDRQALAEEVFADPRLLAKLNRIIHPGVIREMERRLTRSSRPVRVAVIPLLFEAGLNDDFDYIVTVAADPQTVRKRTASARGMTEREIARRRSAQLPLAEKIRRADFVIDNNGTVAETRKQAEKIWQTLTGSSGTSKKSDKSDSPIKPGHSG